MDLEMQYLIYWSSALVGYTISLVIITFGIRAKSSKLAKDKAELDQLLDQSVCKLSTIQTLIEGHKHIQDGTEYTIKHNTMYVTTITGEFTIYDN
jgi:hypothetical protein